MAFDGHDHDLSAEFAQPAQPTIDPVDDFLLPFSFDEQLAGPASEPHPASNDAVDQQAFFPDWVNQDVFLDGPSHCNVASNETQNDFAGFQQNGWQPEDPTRNDDPIGQPAAPLAPGVTRYPDHGAHQSFGFHENLIDPTLRGQRMQPYMQEPELPPPGPTNGNKATASPAPRSTGKAQSSLPAFHTSMLGVRATTTAVTQPPLLEALKSRFDAQHQPRNTAIDAPFGYSPTLPGFTVPSMRKTDRPAPETIERDQSKQRMTGPATPASHWDRPNMPPAPLSRSPALNDLVLQQTATPPPMPKSQKPFKKADRKGMPRTAVSTNKLLVNGGDFAKKVALQRVPLQVQQDDSDEVAANAQYWVPLIANAFDATFQAQPHRPEEYTEAGLAEWTRWQEEHDDKVQALLHAHPEPQVLVQACAFLFLVKVLEAHENNQGPIQVLRTVAVGGSNPHLRCSDRICAAISALERFPIARYDLLRVERLADFAANPKGFGDRKIENLWINYGKKKNKAPFLKREVTLAGQSAATTPALQCQQHLVSGPEAPTMDQHASTASNSTRPAASMAPPPTASSSLSMMPDNAYLTGQRMSPYPAPTQAAAQQHMTHAQSKKVQQPRQSMLSTPRLSQMSPPRPGMMRAASRRAPPPIAATPGSSIVGIGSDGTDRAEVMMSEKAMGKKRKLDDVSGKEADDVDSRDAKKRM